jgi:hypothetical protein
MLYREIIAVCSQIHTKHINTLCGQNVELVNIKPGGTYSKHCASIVNCRKHEHHWLVARLIICQTHNNVMVIDSLGNAENTKFHEHFKERRSSK